MGENDWKVVRTDQYPILDDRDIEIQRLREALQKIADARTDVFAGNELSTIAKEALEK